jgi:hypothetical protein
MQLPISVGSVKRVNTSAPHTSTRPTVPASTRAVPCASAKRKPEHAAFVSNAPALRAPSAAATCVAVAGI